MKKRLIVLLTTVITGAAAFSLTGSRAPERPVRQAVAPEGVGDDVGVVAAEERKSSIVEVLDMATKARAMMAKNLKDYTARFVAQEIDSSGVLGDLTEINLKVQTRLRDGTETAPMRVYLDFTKPESANGREVIWAQDMHDGKLVVHEAGLLGMVTLSLDPHGMLAMRGQRYPISEIGLVRLMERLIERGKQDLNAADMTVLITDSYPFDGLTATRIEVQRGEPTGAEDDFSRAEIIIDPERHLILQYQSYGWPIKAGDTAPLLESFTYYNVKTNVGLTKLDFDPSNPAYRFP